MAADFDPDEVVRRVTESLVKKHPDRDRVSLEALVRAEVDELKDRPIQDFVGVLAERAVKKQLKKG